MRSCCQDVFVRHHELGEVYHAPFDVLFAEGDYMQPDILFVQKDRLGILSDRGVEGVPDLVVEILSPATAGRDRGIKLARYRQFSVPEHWVVDPEAGTIEVWWLGGGAAEPEVFGGEDTLRWQPVPGGATLEIPVADVVAEED